MPRRKITIAEAMAVLKDHNLDVVVKSQPIAVALVEPIGEKGVIRRIGTTATTISLYSQHILGCGGSLTISESGEKGVSENTSITYGPGVVTVPSSVAAQLLHQDQLARQADARFLDRTQRSYLVMQRQGPDGSQANVGVQVDNTLLDGEIDLNRMTTMVV